MKTTSIHTHTHTHTHLHTHTHIHTSHCQEMHVECMLTTMFVHKQLTMMGIIQYTYMYVYMYGYTQTFQDSWYKDNSPPLLGVCLQMATPMVNITT